MKSNKEITTEFCLGSEFIYYNFEKLLKWNLMWDYFKLFLTQRVYNMRDLTQLQKVVQEIKIVPHLYILKWNYF